MSLLSWLLPAALALFVIGLWLTRRTPRTDRVRASLLRMPTGQTGNRSDRGALGGDTAGRAPGGAPAGALGGTATSARRTAVPRA